MVTLVRGSLIWGNKVEKSAGTSAHPPPSASPTCTPYMVSPERGEIGEFYVVLLIFMNNLFLKRIDEKSIFHNTRVRNILSLMIR